MDQEQENSHLPSILTVSKFSVARAKEIKSLNQALASNTAIKLAFQKLPRHMRRRVMSHNVKRLPRRLREIHMSQMTKSGLPPKQKRPSRKYRRRPFNLMSDYVRRQKRYTWLSTHIWHAKRFHMIEKWGYKLPHRPCDRAFKSCYRATAKHCLIQDISYYCCIELSGSINELKKGFLKMTDTNIFSNYLFRGFREGTLTLSNHLTNEPIGPVYFTWKPYQKDDKKTIWLWLHAAFYSESVENVKECFNLNLHCAEDKCVIYQNETIQLQILKYDLSRFRLIGPLSNAVLWNALKLAKAEHVDNEQNCWVKHFIEDNKECDLNKMGECFNPFQFTSPSDFSPHVILPLIIQDPRFNMPKKRTKAIIDNSHFVLDTSWNNELENPIWNENFRKHAAKNKLSQADLAKLHEKLLVPGTALENIPSLLPITLIHRPGRRTKDFRGYGSGWDLILPSAWAQPIWLSLIMWGARSGGLREMDSVIFESDQQHFLYPDTKSGKTEETVVSRTLKEDFFRLPPNKRTNYNKFGVTSPFDWNWEHLLTEWGCSLESASKFTVLRNKNVLQKLQNCLIDNKTFEDCVSEIRENTLIPVSLKFCKKGSCRKLALICLPKIEDLSVTPVESLHKDPNEIKRKELRYEHKELLKRLRKRRQRAKKKGEKIPIDMELLKEYSKKMRELWVPATNLIRHSCSREVMGFVKHGDFSFLLAKTKAIGYITAGALKKLSTEVQTNKVLIRNTNSRQYRLAILDIISNT